MSNLVNNETVATTDAPFSLKPLMFETFVCTMALMAFAALAAPIARVIGLEAWQLGTAMTVAGIAWVAMARFWGKLSDRKGRRPVMLFGLAGFVISYALLALFIDFAMQTAMVQILAFIGIVIGRGIAGIFYAAVPSTSAALVADHIPPKQRAAAMAGIGASSGAGMVIGPSFAGLIGPYSLSIPLYITAVLPAIALIVIWRVLPRREHHVKPDGNSLKLNDIRLRWPVRVAFVAAFSVAVAQITVGFFALDRLLLEPANTARTAGIALAIVGVTLIVAQIVLRKLDWQPQRLIKCGGIIAAAGFSCTIFSSTPLVLWFSYGVAGFGMGWVFPSVSALAANSVENHEQGAAAGTISAAQGLGIVVGPIVGTGVYSIDNGLPYGLIAVMLMSVTCWRSAK
ncbi:MULTISPECIES: MFS transporter [unclassified Pseudoalteromonas]|uniref:MFS transporter n=1 Tax=unclassified Pseudoalteromonas TaxID=194690 RepID=UPI0025B57487|nr:MULTISPECIES: MFS transporter [unclassified Pseudoalteromonas]MDN3379500.1 MFS transporter [Pseudoalteromonas sp. APC 3893]MDN3387840.1 MFS transporter [Pseudoalteromonas sp. APC 4017]